MDEREKIRRLVELHAQGAISRRTLIEAAGLGDVIKDDEDSNVADEVENIDEDDFLDRTFPLGTLIRPSTGSRVIGTGTVNVSLANKPGGRPIVAPERAPAYVTVKANGYWTVVQHRSGWTKIASADGQHAGWTFYVRDYFERV